MRFNVRGERRPDRIGVWVRRPDKGPSHEDKIAAIGIRVRRWVSFHGISLNVEPDLAHFSGIVPCGISEQRYGVTSLVDLGLPVTMADADDALRKAFEKLSKENMEFFYKTLSYQTTNQLSTNSQVTQKKVMDFVTFVKSLVRDFLQVNHSAHGKVASLNVHFGSPGEKEFRVAGRMVAKRVLARVSLGTRERRQTNRLMKVRRVREPVWVRSLMPVSSSVPLLVVLKVVSAVFGMSNCKRRRIVVLCVVPVVMQGHSALGHNRPDRV